MELKLLSRACTVPLVEPRGTPLSEPGAVATGSNPPNNQLTRVTAKLRIP